MVNNSVLNLKVVLGNLNVVVANLTLQEMKFGWQIVVGSIIGFFGAEFGSVGGVGGGAIFVTMFSLVIGFDPKSTTTISKCKKQTYPCGRSSIEDL